MADVGIERVQGSLTYTTTLYGEKQTIQKLLRIVPVKPRPSGSKDQIAGFILTSHTNMHQK